MWPLAGCVDGVHEKTLATSWGDSSAALRVPPAETRLTVYRRTQVLVAAGVEKCEVLRIVTSDLYVVFREHSLGTKATFPPNGVTSVTL